MRIDNKEVKLLGVKLGMGILTIACMMIIIVLDNRIGLTEAKFDSALEKLSWVFFGVIGTNTANTIAALVTGKRNVVVDQQQSTYNNVVENDESDHEPN